jgi:ankyrin repeat protein
MVEFLSENPNINFDKTDHQKYSFTPLLHAAQLQNDGFQIFKILIEKGADPEVGSSGKNAWNTPLMVCAWSGWKKGVEYLLEQGVCTNQQDTNGYTALVKACIRGHYEVALRLAQVTDVTIRSRENKRAEDYIIKLDLPYAKQLVQVISEKKEHLYD